MLSPGARWLRISVRMKRVTVGMVGAGEGKGTSKLTYIEIITVQDDVTRYWFFDGKVNGELPAEVFKPGK